MLLSALFAATVLTSVEDYFPVAVGTKWTYEDQDGRQLVQEIDEPMELEGGSTAIVRSKYAGGRKLGAELFRTDGESVLLIGFHNPAKKPPVDMLTSPQTILRLGNPRAEWSYTDQVFGGNGPVAVQVKSDSNKAGSRKVLDRSVDTVLVHTVIKYGGKNGFEQRQDMVFGKGIGLVEATEATKVQGKTVKKVLKLIKFEEP
jgi:hypothetical protein